MKKLFFLLVLILFFSNNILSQKKRTINDPVLYLSASKNIQYPVEAIGGSIYGRFYAAFEIDSLGDIRNVRVIYPILSKKMSKFLGFDSEIINGLYKTPRLRYFMEGKYILPIAFVYINVYYGLERMYPTNIIPSTYHLENYQFLKEIQISARSDLFKINRSYSNIPPASRQVVEF